MRPGTGQERVHIVSRGVCPGSLASHTFPRMESGRGGECALAFIRAWEGTVDIVPFGGRAGREWEEKMSESERRGFCREKQACRTSGHHRFRAEVQTKPG